MTVRRLGIVLLASALAGCAAMMLGDSEEDLVLEDLLSGPDSRLHVLAPAVHRRTVTLDLDGERYDADVYRTRERPRAGLVLVPGLAPAGKDDARLTTLAATLARVHFLVLVPDLTGFRSLRVRSGDIRYIVDATRHLRRRRGLDPGQPVGVGAFSFAVGPALIAALDPALRHELDFVLAVGGYHDLHQLIAHATTGVVPGVAGSRRAASRASGLGKWVIALGASDSLASPRDRALVRAHARRVLRGDAEPDTSPSLPGLSTRGRALIDLITNSDPRRVNDLLAGLPPVLRAELTALNPAEQDLSRLKARLLLVHGRSDHLIPFQQSLALARAVPADRASLFLLDGLAHVDLRPAAGDLPVLRAAVRALLALRDGRRDAGGQAPHGPLQGRAPPRVVPSPAVPGHGASGGRRSLARNRRGILIQDVPAPATLGLLGRGLVGFAVVRRRR